MPALLDQPFLFVDLETTGANAQRDRITEIGVVAWDGETAEEWSTLVNPETTIPPFISQLTGISDAMVANAPTFAELAVNLHERLSGPVFVAHNARFDYGFLKNEFKRVGLDFRARVVCTVKLSKKLFPREYKHNLDAVSARNGLTAEGDRHRALTDARLIYQFLCKLKAEMPADSLNAVLDDISRQPSLPAGLDAEVLDGIPDGHGVYLFYGENDLPLYVGKSNTLKKRVLAHFAADVRANKEMRISQQITRIDWLSTAGEMGALLTEARLIKQLQPIHNQRLRRNTDLCAWQYEPNADGTAAPFLVYARDLDFGRQSNLFGLYTSQREATNTLRKIAEANKLCMVRLGLERASRRAATPCFGMQIGKCRGACVGKEPLLTHQARVCAILAKLKLASWPYGGMVVIKEINPASAATDWHLVDHWCHLGTVSSESALEALLAEQPKPVFDLDSYKIISKQIRSGQGVEVLTLASTASQSP